ncbi:glycosyltransferase family 4 protein [Salinimicrobium sp. TH3]|uniref:glycosyltransferase family 4 protein n=1 Tax=Salinimicrobium sp. TH3 TaxID=2997342 RepID=UPI00227690B9|nr:glycosyltransferase family 4 protein [Salinimicrobium sp. TH3]MCY2687949.1 glycosyltransferase family 4 protein [Salinimicrobium sp. TH3]
MEIVLSHPTGNAFVRAAAKGFLEADMLLQFHTAIASFPGTPLDKIGFLSPFSEIHRRRFDAALRTKTHLWPWMELWRLLAGKAGLNRLTTHENGFFSVDAVYKHLDKKVASQLKNAQKNGANAIYAYEDGAASSFTRAKELNMHCLYDLPIGYWRTARQLMDIERQKRPEWAKTISSFSDSPEKLNRKDEELRLADNIIVASKFTATTLLNYPGKLAPIDVVPYAFPSVGNPKEYRKLNGGKLKLLFVGGLSQRKGIANLFEAVETFKNYVELTIIGYKAVEGCSILDKSLAKHRWIPSLPHEKILKIMREQDVLLFPSLFEGFGLVITEAMSQGTPVITTDRTAGPDFITHNENGWLIEAGSTLAIEVAIQDILQNPTKVETFGRAAMKTASQRSWRKYGEELVSVLKNTYKLAY